MKAGFLFCFLIFCVFFVSLSLSGDRRVYQDSYFVEPHAMFHRHTLHPETVDCGSALRMVPWAPDRTKFSSGLLVLYKVERLKRKSVTCKMIS